MTSCHTDFKSLSHSKYVLYLMVSKANLLKFLILLCCELYSNNIWTVMEARAIAHGEEIDVAKRDRMASLCW